VLDRSFGHDLVPGRGEDRRGPLGLYAGRPVPAGMRRPMMTFSLRPRRSSVLPQIAASVSTLVVSWKDDALMNDSVERRPS
jgi:hypothetical protein